MIKLDIYIGDTILVGRFKNKRIEVKEIGVDEHGSPTVNGKSILKIRIEKLMKTKKNIKEAILNKDWGELIGKTVTLIDTLVVTDFKTNKNIKLNPGDIVKIIDSARVNLDIKADIIFIEFKGKKYVSHPEALLNKSNLNESKQIKEAIDYEDEIVAPSWLIRDREYVWIMGAEPLLVIYTGPGKKPGSKNFKFKEKPAVNHDLSPRDVKKYIRYKVGEAPGPFGYDDSPLGGLNKFKNPMESKQISLAGIAKTILKTK